MNAKPYLILSVIVNLILASALVWIVRNKPAAPAAAPTAVAPADAKPTDASAKKKADQAQPAAASLKPDQKFDWRMVESEDYKKYIANLRSIGCPEETIRDIIIADVDKLFAARKRALRAASTNKFQFWKAGNPMAGMFDAERMGKSQELAKERRALLKDLLGIEPEDKPDMMAGVNDMISGMLDFLPEGKQSQVMDVMMKYQAKLAKSMGNGAPDAEDMKNMQKVQKEMEAELAGVMTPQELEDYQLRMSQTAMVMRMQLAPFEPTEQEFRDIFKLKKGYDDEYGMMGMGAQTKEEREKRDAAKKEMDAQIKALLGDARYADYERPQDWAYSAMVKTAERNGLTKDDANKVYDMKKAAEDQAKKVRADKSLNKDQQKAALTGIRTETENSIRAVFGDKASQSYLNGQSAYWLKGISPDPKPVTQ